MHKTWTLIGLVAVAGLVSRGAAEDKAPAPSPVAAAAPATAPTTQAKDKDKERASALAEKLSVTDHELKLDGSVLKYRATAGTMPLKDEAGKARANFFFVAYDKTPEVAPEQRPITFVFNGGPGAAAIWLHLGTAGPKRVELDAEGYPSKPPYKLIDNPTTWLTASDLVFIDPVGTGYSRPAEGVKGEEFYGVQQDIESVSEFIRLYLTRAGRWGSPKFVAGESYGTTRAAMLSEHLLDRYGIALNGVVLISTVLNFQTLSPSEGNELPFPLFFPTYSAAAFYHKKLPADLQKDLGATLAEVKKWVVEVYTPALAKGTSLAGDERKAVVAAMARYTGISEQLIERANLRLSPGEFEKSLLADQRKVIGRFDSRITGEAMDQMTNYPEHDPSLSRYVGVYSQTFNDYSRRSLKYESDLVYEFLSGRVQPWNWGRGANNGHVYVADNLRSAMVKNPHLKLLVCSGYYDLATPFFGTDYQISHMDLSAELRKNVTQTYFEGGHMMYHHAPSLEKLNKDITGFMEAALK